MEIRAATSADWPEIERIYCEGIRSGNATFQTEAEIPDGATWFAGKLPGLVFVANAADGSVQGWCALSSVSSRYVYRGVAEVSVYVSATAQGNGVGTALLQHLVVRSEAAGIWTLQAGIFPENVASIRLHKKCGFRILGIREKVGQMRDTWRDVALLERRSPHVF